MNQEEYNHALKRIEKGEKLINQQGGFMKANKNMVDRYQHLAEACLLYEIDNDLLPI